MSRATLSALLAVALGCERREPIGARPPDGVRSALAVAPASSPPRSANAARKPKRHPQQELTWIFEGTPAGAIHAVVLLPERAEHERFPVLFALHGRGEAHKGPARGARGWVDDYWLPRAIARLAAPPLKSADFLDFVTDARLAELNTGLVARPYGGLIVVCAYTPDILAGDRAFSLVTPFAKFVTGELLSRVYSETPALGTPASTGIDGVSLGGRASLLVAFSAPEKFGAAGALQAAFDSAEAAALTALARRARERNPKLRIRLVTSEKDFFLRPNRVISNAFRSAGLAHAFAVVPGPHDYPWNRGPGAYEMLLFHDRSLRGAAFE